jgi:hypothetical protein
VFVKDILENSPGLPTQKCDKVLQKKRSKAQNVRMSFKQSKRDKSWCLLRIFWKEFPELNEQKKQRELKFYRCRIAGFRGGEHKVRRSM